MMTRRPTAAVLIFVLALAWTSIALACPNCRDSLSDNDPAGAGIVQGFFWSIIIMLSTPVLILTGLGSYFYLLVRRARSDGSAASGSSTARPVSAAL